MPTTVELDDKHVVEVKALEALNNDGLIDRHEAKTCFANLLDGVPPTDEELEELFTEAGVSSHDGMRPDDFVHIMSITIQQNIFNDVVQASAAANATMANAAGFGQPASATFKKLSAILQADKFHDLRCQEMWERNHITHKQADMDDKALDRKCYHPGTHIQAAQVAHDLHEIRFTCCEGEEMGLTPVIFSSPGCCRGRHLTLEEFKEGQQTEKTPSALN